MSSRFTIMNEVVSDAWNEAMEDLQKQIADAEKLLVKSNKSDPWNAKSVLEYCKKYKCKELEKEIEDELDRRKDI